MGRPRNPANSAFPAGIYPSKGWLFWRDPATAKWVKVCRIADWDTKPARDRWVDLSTAKPKGGTVSHMLAEHLKHRRQLVREGKLAARTFEDNEEYCLHLNKAFGAMDYWTVTGRDCAAYLQHRTWQPPARKGPDGKLVTPPARRAPVRANKELSLLSSAYTWALSSPDFPLVTTNPCYGVERNPTQRSERCPEVWEIDAAKMHATPMWSLILDLAYIGGKRGIEMRLLPKKAVQPDGIHFKSAKGGVDVVIEWSPELYDTVLRMFAWSEDIEQRRKVSSPYLILARSGGPYTSQGWKTMMYKIVRAAMADTDNPLKEAFSLHNIRSRSATDEEELDGTNPQHRLGHTRRATTDIYMRGRRLKKVKALPLKRA